MTNDSEQAIYKSYGSVSNNRQFHEDKDASYMLPNDQNEIERLLMQQKMLFNFLNGNFLAPIEQDLKKGIIVLDSGCGPGVWVTDMAKTYPKSTFHGIDISSTVPEIWKLQNTIYTSGNITKSISYKENTFDYIHQRLLILGLTRNDWKNAMRNFYKVLKPGGYAEFLEVKCHDHEGALPLFKEFTDTYYKMMVDRGMVPDINSKLRGLMREAGFENITVVYKDFPLDFKKEEGKLHWENLFGVFEGFSSILVDYNDNWKDVSDVNEHLVKMREEVLKAKYDHQYGIVYGQKPF